MAELTINTGDITAALQRNLAGYSPSLEATQVGRVLEVVGGTVGLALNLDEDSIGAVIVGDGEAAAAVEEGTPVRATGNILSMPVGDAMLGRVVNALGVPIDGRGPIVGATQRRMEVQAPGITGRKPVHEPLQTGI